MSSGSDPTISSRETCDSNNQYKRRRGAQTQNSKCQKRPKNEAHPGLKGVSLQKNKNWGAQIYLDNKRFWLGTFKTKEEAAMAYDSAALKLRNGNVGNSDCDFPSTNLTIDELSFQRRFTTEAILDMIRDGSYPSKLANYINLQRKTEQDIIKPPHSEIFSKLLFEKELTPSDVGKLNRLVVPKKAAVKFFPPVPTSDHKGQRAEPVELTFYDMSMRVWKFRYCYWNSSQILVFSRGWNKFVTAHNLQPRDMITFWMCKQPDGNMNNAAAVLYGIEVSHRNQVENDKLVTSTVDDEEVKDDVPLNPIESIQFSGVGSSKGVSVKLEDDENGLVETKKVFRLFGVKMD